MTATCAVGGLVMRVGFGQVGLFLSAAFFSDPAAAQQTPPTPGQADQAVPRRDQVDPSTAPQNPPESQVRVDTRGAITPPPCALADSPLRVSLNSVSFQNPAGGPI